MFVDEKFKTAVEQFRKESIAWYEGWDFAGEEIWIPGRECDIRCRIYRPKRPVAERVPVFFNVHGGGWAVHQCEADQPFCVKVAERLGILVISVDYRLAPEHQFPVPVNDVFDVIQHVYQNAEQYGIDPLRMGIGGHSAGGHISISAALYAKESGAFPLRCMILDYPGIAPGDDMREAAKLQGELTDYQKEFLELCTFFAKCSQPSEEYLEDYHYVLNYATEEQLSDLPPAVMTVCENDLLKFQDMEFAQMLIKAGVETTVRLFKGVVHGFTADLYYTPEAEEGHAMMIEGIKKYLLN